MCTGFSSRKGERKQMTVASLLNMVDTALMCLSTPLSRSWSIKETVVYTCLDYATLPGDEEFFFLWGWKESRRDNVREGERGRAGRFFQLLWIRYCLVVEHSWETSGHIHSPWACTHSRVETGAYTWNYYYFSEEVFLFSCLFVSHFSVLSPFLCFFISTSNSLFLLSHLFQFLLFWCGFTSRRTGAFGAADCWTAAACCAADVMGESYIGSHWLVSSETRVIAQFHPS